MKQQKSTRLIKLMELLKWKGVDNWSLLQEQYITPEILPFKAWVVRNTKYIQTEEARLAVQMYFINGTNGTVESGFYIRKDRGVEALLALYAKEQEK